MMSALTDKKVLVSGASIAGLSVAHWFSRLGYTVTVVEQAGAIRTAGAAVDVRGITVDTVRRMGLYERLKAHRLTVDRIEFKNSDDSTEGSIVLTGEATEQQSDDIEIERDKLLNILRDDLKNDVDFIFNDRVTALCETEEGVGVTFKTSVPCTFDLVFGCDGMHSGVRKIWFGHEKEYVHYLGAYFAITTVDKLLIDEKTMQLYNVPDNAIILNAYNKKTDVIFSFFSKEEIEYDYRNTEQQWQFILTQFADKGWRSTELLEEIRQSERIYFDKFCQVKMPLWTKGRVALVGDAGYCASPAAGMGASLAIEGAAVLADAFRHHTGNYEAAFQDYNKNLRPFIEAVQATAEQNVKETFIPRTEKAIRARNAQTMAL